MDKKDFKSEKVMKAEAMLGMMGLTMPEAIEVASHLLLVVFSVLSTSRSDEGELIPRDKLLEVADDTIGMIRDLVHAEVNHEIASKDAN